MNCATPLLSWGKNILEQSDPNGEEILKLDEAKSQIRNCKFDRYNMRFRNFGFEVSLRPISNLAASALDSSSMLMPLRRGSVRLTQCRSSNHPDGRRRRATRTASPQMGVSFSSQVRLARMPRCNCLAPDSSSRPDRHYGKLWLS